MSIAWTAVNFGAVDGGDAAAFEPVVICAGGFVSGGGAFGCSDAGGPVKVRIESSTGFSFGAGAGVEDWE